MYTPPLAVDVSVVDDVHTIVGAVLVVLVLPGLLVGVMLLVSVLPQPLLVPPMFPVAQPPQRPEERPPVSSATADNLYAVGQQLWLVGGRCSLVWSYDLPSSFVLAWILGVSLDLALSLAAPFDLLLAMTV